MSKDENWYTISYLHHVEVNLQYFFKPTDTPSKNSDQVILLDTNTLMSLLTVTI